MHVTHMLTSICICIEMTSVLADSGEHCIGVAALLNSCGQHVVHPSCLMKAIEMPLIILN